MRKKVFSAILAVGLITVSAMTTCAQDSDRNDVRSRIASGGWNPVYGELVNEAEYAKMAAALYTGSIGAYFNDYLDRSIAKFQRTAPDVAKKALWDAVKRAFKDRGKSFKVGKIGIKAGIATYRRWKYVSAHVPTGKTEKYKIKGPLGTWTYGYRPEMKLVKKKIPLPNHHQPYVAFRIYPTSGNSGSSGGGGNSGSATGSRIDYTIYNSTDRTIKFQLPSGKWYKLSPGKTGKYYNTRSNPRITIPGSKRGDYRLTSGKHKFWIMTDGRIGFDRNYR